MPNRILFWVGGATLDKGISGAPFDWNVASNWRECRDFISYFNYPASRPPTAYDRAFIGLPDLQYLDATTTANITNLKPKAPLLFGGYTPVNETTGTGNWIYGTSLGYVSGATVGITAAVSGNGNTGALEGIYVSTGRDAPPGYPLTYGYPYTMLGMQLTQEYDSNSLAQLLVAQTALPSGISGAGTEWYAYWSKDQWQYAIDNNLLSYSGLTYLNVKTQVAGYDTFANPHNLYAADIKINYSDNVLPTPTGGFTASNKYNTQLNMNFNNGGNIYIKNGKFRVVTSDFVGISGSNRSLGTLKIDGSYIYDASIEIWSNVVITDDTVFGSANFSFIGPYYYGSDLNNFSNYLGNYYVRDNSNRSSKDVVLNTYRIIRGTYSKNVINSIFGITFAGSTIYPTGKSSLSVNISKGAVLGAGNIPEYNPQILSVEKQRKGVVVIDGITADKVKISYGSTVPKNYFAYNTSNNTYYCVPNEDSATCSSGKLHDWIPDVFITGANVNVNEFTLIGVDLNTLYCVAYATDRIPLYTIGKMELITSNLDLQYYGKKSYGFQPVDWKFGIIKNSATGITMNGGLILDPYSTVLGNENIRLLNYAVNTLGKNTRTNTLINEIIGNTILTESPRTEQA